MKCPHCLFENSQDAQFCIDCGSPLKSEQKPATFPCPKCHAENSPDSSFCINCGYSLKAGPPAPAAVLPTTAKPEPATPPQPKLGAETPADVAPSAAKAKPEPALPPAQKKEPPSPPPVAEQVEIKQLRQPDFSSGPAVSGMNEIEVASPTPERDSSEAKRLQTKKLVLPAGIVLAVVAAALAVWYFALRPQPRPKAALQEAPAAKSAPIEAPSPALTALPQPIPPSATQNKNAAEKKQIGQPAQPPASIPSPAENRQGAAASRPAAPPIPSQPAGRPAVAASEQIARGVEAFQHKDYDECLRQMKSVLARDPGNKTALRYVADSQNKKREAEEIGSLIKAAGEAYQAGKFEQCLEQTRRALALDPDQEEALHYEEIAHQKLAPQRIKSLVDEFTTAVNGGRLASYYEAACLPALYHSIKKDVELISGMYSQFKSQSSQTTIRFLDNGLMEVRFSNITTGRLKADNRQMIIFEGAYIWTLQRQGDRWMIAGLQSQPIRKKT
jgi:tetratricopeptide (TPR) repeat protein